MVSAFDRLGERKGLLLAEARERCGDLPGRDVASSKQGAAPSRQESWDRRAMAYAAGPPGWATEALPIIDSMPGSRLDQWITRSVFGGGSKVPATISR